MPAPKKKPASASAIMKGLLGEDNPSTTLPAQPVSGTSPSQPEVPQEKAEVLSPKLPERTTEPSRNMGGRPKVYHEYPLERKGYYIPTDVSEALRVRQFYDPKPSVSAHVVLALRQYLGMEIPDEEK